MFDRPADTCPRRTRVRGNPEVGPVISLTTLKSRTAKDLAALAKCKRVPGWHAMRKEDLLKALVKLARIEEARSAKSAKKPSANGSAAKVATAVAKSVAKVGSNGNGRSVSGNGVSGNGVSGNGAARNAGSGKVSGNGGGHAFGANRRSSRSEKRLDAMRTKLAQNKDLSFSRQDAGRAQGGSPPGRDRLVVMVRGPYWLHACWELTRASIERARVALGQRWHSARSVLRLCQVSRDGTTSSVRKLVRDVEIHGGVNNWYVDVVDPPKSYQMDIGYLAPDGRFLSLARSNVVSTPPAGSVESVDNNWVEVALDCDRIYAMSGGYSPEGDNSELKNLFEQRLRRPMGSSLATRFGIGTGVLNAKREFNFCVDAELVIFGVAEPGSYVTLRGEPVRLQSDGSFSVRFNLPDRRQVLPVVAASPDGVEQQTIVLAVERNTKVMEPVTRDPEN